MPEPSKRINTIHWGWHVAFWIFYYAIYCLHYSGKFDDLSQVFGLEIVELPVKIIFTYSLLYILIPRYLLSKKYALFTLYILVAIVLAVIAQRFMINIISYNFIYSDLHSPQSLFDIGRNLNIIARIYSAAIPAAALKATAEWYQYNQLIQEVKNEKLNAELKYLKSQLNPHFFFNTLNNLYGLILQKSEDASKVVLMLSELMSFMLYGTDKRSIPVSREVSHIKNYMALEQIRFGDRFNFSLNVYGDIEQYEIAPLLLLPFVENSIKHGIHDEIDQAWINMDLTIENGKLIFKIDNSVPDNQSTNDEYTKRNSGIGLDNVKRRLELLYPDAHQLKILDQENVFFVSLKLNLDQLNKDM